MKTINFDWEVIAIMIVLILGTVAFIIRRGSIQKALVYICLRAEKHFGSKTGVIKLRCVYNWFVTKYPIMSLFISFEDFAKMVDVALVEMRKLIQTNMGVFEYMEGKEE